MKKRYLLLIPLLLIISGVVFLGLRHQALFKFASPEDTLPIGVVDFQKLLRLSPSWDRLMELDRKVTEMEGVLSSSSAGVMDTLLGEHMLGLKRERVKAAEEMEKEMLRIKKQLEKELTENKKQAVETIRAIEEKFTRMQKARNTDSQNVDQGGFPSSEEEIRGPHAAEKKMVYAEIRDSVDDLYLLSKRQVAAKTLELEQKAKARIEELQKKQDAELNSFEMKMLQANQAQKLNLQLKMQVAATAEERNKIQDDLNKLAEDETAQKETMVAGMHQESERLRSFETVALRKEIFAFKVRLDAELSQKVNAIQDRASVKISGKTGVPPAQLALGNFNQPQDLKREYNEKMFKLQAEQKKAMEQAGQQYEKKKKELAERLKKIEQDMFKRVMEKRKLIEKSQKEEYAKKEEALSSLKKQRERLFLSMVDELKGMVGKVARKKRVPLVLAGYISSLECEDLTEISARAIKEEKPR
ncbi:MAG: hypothetical protein V2A78_10670 [bacterium]